MSNKVKDIKIKNRPYFFVNDIIAMENVYPNNIKIEKNHIKIFLFTILDMWQSNNT